MAATIIEEGLVDREFITARVDDFEAYASFIRDYAPENVAEACGVPAADIRVAARLYAQAKPAACFHGLGMTEHLQGTEGVMTLINLALLTGNLGKSGSGINPLRGQNNAQGSAHMGCEPVTLAGSQSFAEAARFEAAWGQPLPAQPWQGSAANARCSLAGQFKALWASGYDIGLTLANMAQTGQALQQLELVIVQDLFLNETAKAFGHVFLPAASVFERDGTFMNSDRRRATGAASGTAAGRRQAGLVDHSKQLAARMGHPQGFEFDNAEAIWNEVRQVWPGGAGLSYARLEHESINWPCPGEDHPGTPVLHRQRFAHAERTALQAIPFIASSEQCDADYPLLLTTGRTLYHFNAGTMSYRTANAELRPSDTLDISPADADRLGLQEGQQVRVRSRYGCAELPLHISERIKPGELYSTFHRPDLQVNRLTSNVRDRLVNSPEYKLTAVRIEVL
ncbi:MAG: molybdopterin-dependent oxidoreductase [Chitinivorax sp.]